MTVRAILWDADGVLQAGPAGWAEFLGDALGEQAEAIGLELFSGLGDALAGRIDMQARVTDVLAAHGLAGRVDRVLALWRRVDPLAASREVAARVRASGVASYLATNQDTWRATCMRDLGLYDDLLDGAFYSCDLGVAKPDPAYFHTVLANLGLAAPEVAFVDDQQENVAAALDLGLAAVRWRHDEGVPALRQRLAAYGVLG